MGLEGRTPQFTTAFRAEDIVFAVFNTLTTADRTFSPVRLYFFKSFRLH